jgi:hypothetical protein
MTFACRARPDPGAVRAERGTAILPVFGPAADRAAPAGEGRIGAARANAGQGWARQGRQWRKASDGYGERLHRPKPGGFDYFFGGGGGGEGAGLEAVGAGPFATTVSITTPNLFVGGWGWFGAG